MGKTELSASGSASRYRPARTSVLLKMLSPLAWDIRTLDGFSSLVLGSLPSRGISFLFFTRSISLSFGRAGSGRSGILLSKSGCRGKQPGQNSFQNLTEPAFRTVLTLAEGLDSVSKDNEKIFFRSKQNLKNVSFLRTRTDLLLRIRTRRLHRNSRLHRL